MDELSRYAHDAVQMTEREFVRHHPYNVLLVDKAAFDDPTKSVPFDTVVIDTREVVEPESYVVFPIRKKAGNPWPERISLGRARNCDVVIRHNSISKLHAHFFVDGREFVFCDASSKNGSELNGRRLRAHERCRMQYGDVIGFGLIDATFDDAAGLYTFARGFAEATLEHAS